MYRTKTKCVKSNMVYDIIVLYMYDREAEEKEEVTT